MEAYFVTKTAWLERPGYTYVIMHTTAQKTEVLPHHFDTPQQAWEHLEKILPGSFHHSILPSSHPLNPIGWTATAFIRRKP